MELSSVFQVSGVKLIKVYGIVGWEHEKLTAGSTSKGGNTGYDTWYDTNTITRLTRN